MNQRLLPLAAHTLAAATLAALLATPLQAAPAVPRLVNYQGFATTSAGASLPDGNYDILFKIYPASSGGTAIWGEKQVATLSAGQFSVLLGNGGAIDGTIPHGDLTDLFGTSAAASGDVFIGITINNAGQATEAEFSPRQQLLANPFAHRAKLADTATTVLASAIGTDSLANSAVNSAKIADGTVNGADLATGTIVSANIATGGISETNLAASAVTTGKLAANAITADKIASGAVTTEKLPDGSVTAAKLGANAVTEAKLATGAVTSTKLAAGAITAANLADGTVSTPKLTDAAVTEAKIAAAAVTAAKVADATLTGAKVLDDSLTAADISFATGTSSLSLFPTSGTSGVHLTMTSAASTFRAPTGSTYSVRFSMLDPGGNVLSTGGLQVLPGFLKISSNVDSNGAATGFAQLGPTGQWSASSDRRLKKDIHPAVGMLDKTLKLNPMWYRFKSGDENDPESLGFIAQDVATLLPSLVDDSADMLTLNYAGLSTVAIGAIQEQQALISSQAERLSKLEAENAALARRLERLEAAVRNVAAK